jgi:hypothetical protein
MLDNIFTTLVIPILVLAILAYLVFWLVTKPASMNAVLLSGTSAAVTFVPPSQNFFEKLLKRPLPVWTITSTPGNISATGTTSPIILEGLSPDTSYIFKVTGPARLLKRYAESNSIFTQWGGSRLPDPPVPVITKLTWSSFKITYPAVPAGSTQTSYSIMLIKDGDYFPTTATITNGLSVTFKNMGTAGTYSALVVATYTYFVYDPITMKNVDKTVSNSALTTGSVTLP